MVNVLLDTNFLLMMCEKKIDIYSEIMSLYPERVYFLIASGTVDELHKIASKNKPNSMCAKFILKNFRAMVLKYFIRIVHSTGRVDDWIYKYAIKERVHVATNDIKLKKKVLKRNLSVISLKNFSKLDIS